MFTPKIGEDSHFDQYFPDGLKPPTRKAGRSFSIIDDCLLFFLVLQYIYTYIYIFVYTHVCVCVSVALEFEPFYQGGQLSTLLFVCVCVSCVCWFQD